MPYKRGRREYTYTKWISQISYQEINWQTIFKELQITNIMLASLVLQTIIILNSSYCNHNGTPRYSNYVESGLSQIFPICVSVMFHKYRYHHRSIHLWALRIHTRYLSVIHKISWITHKEFIHSFRSPYADYILRTIPGIWGRLIPHIENARNYKL